VVGGVCINTGTIPSKTMRERCCISPVITRSIYRDELPREGKDHDGRSGFPRAAPSSNGNRRHGAQLSRQRVEIFNGVASFVDDHHVRWTARGDPTPTRRTTSSSRRNAAGYVAEGAGEREDDRQTAIRSRDDRSAQEPDCGGGGVIGGGGRVHAMFAAAGSSVTLIEKRPRLLEFADQEISRR